MKSANIFSFLVLTLFLILCIQPLGAWGWSAHRYINEQAINGYR